MIEIQRAGALDRTGALVFGCANMLYISLCEGFPEFMCVLFVCVCACTVYVCVCLCVCVHVRACARTDFFTGVYMDSMIYFRAICSKVGMAFNLAPLRRSQEEKKTLLIQYVLRRECVCARLCVCVKFARASVCTQGFPTHPVSGYGVCTPMRRRSCSF